MIARSALRFSAAAALALGHVAAFACGHCVEDRIAAVYDHALVQRVAADGHRMAYFAWDGKAARNPALRLRIAELAAAARGVLPGSVRVSAEPEALAVSYDPLRYSEQSIEAALRAKLRAVEVSVVHLQPGRAPAARSLDAGQAPQARSP